MRRSCRACARLPPFFAISGGPGRCRIDRKERARYNECLTPVHIIDCDDSRMSLIFQRIPASIASMTDRKLAKYVQYLKEENKILRARIPGVIHIRPAERERLINFGKAIGTAIEEMITSSAPAPSPAGSGKKRGLRSERRIPKGDGRSQGRSASSSSRSRWSPASAARRFVHTTLHCDGDDEVAARNRFVHSTVDFHSDEVWVW